MAEASLSAATPIEDESNSPLMDAIAIEHQLAITLSLVENKRNKKKKLHYIFQSASALALLGIAVHMIRKSFLYHVKASADIQQIINDINIHNDQYARAWQNCSENYKQYYEDQIKPYASLVAEFYNKTFYLPYHIEGESTHKFTSCADIGFWQDATNRFGQQEMEHLKTLISENAGYFEDYCNNTQAVPPYYYPNAEACEIVPFLHYCKTLANDFPIIKDIPRCQRQHDNTQVPQIGTGLDDPHYLAIIVPLIIFLVSMMILEARKKWLRHSLLFFHFNQSGIKKINSCINKEVLELTATASLDEIEERILLHNSKFQPKLERFKARLQAVAGSKLDKDAPISLLTHSEIAEPKLFRSIFQYADLDERQFSTEASRKSFVRANLSFFARLDNKKDNKSIYQKKEIVQKIFEFANINREYDDLDEKLGLKCNAQ